MGRSRFVFTAAALACAAALLAPVGAQTGRVVVIGDVHGASEGFAAILERSGLIDAKRRWIGGRSVLVQTGDMTDRGTGMREALDLLMALEQQARRAGGRVHAILGNHEVMNLTGEMRDATPEIFATFGGEAAMREAFGPKGTYGRWLRSKPILTTIDGTVFMHAGINPEHSQGSLDDLNRQARRDLEEWDDGVKLLIERKLVSPSPKFMDAVLAARTEIERMNAAAAEGNIPDDAPRTAALLLPVANIGASSLYHPDGPLWFRGFSTWNDAEGAAKIAELQARYRVKRFVSGHTVQSGGRIRERFDSSVFLIDTGMLGRPYFPGGRPSALEITPSGTREIYVE